MKYLITLIFVFVSALSLCAQNKLDDKYGFNIFRLGSTVKDVQAMAKITSLKGKNLSMKYYTVKDIQKYLLFGYPLKDIILGFYKDKLQKIIVDLPNYSPERNPKQLIIENGIHSNIEAEYGNFTTLGITPNDTINDVTLSQLILGVKVSLYRYGYATNNRYIITLGNRYVFEDRELAEEINKETADKTGL